MGHRDFAGDRIEVQRDQTTGHIQAVSQKTNPNLPSAAELDHTWTPIYDGEKIIEIDDSDGRKAHFGYDQEEYLTDVDADRHHAHYDYDDRHHVTQAIEDGRSLRIHYDSEGRPDRVDFPNATSYSVHYSGDAVEVDGPDGDYNITILTTFFRTVERRTSQQ
jgi:YD repeat-containing protein